MENKKLQNKFNDDIIDSIEESKKLGYVPTRFIQMLQKSNGNANELAISLVSKDVTFGLKKLWEKGRLDLTMEARIIKPDFQELFPKEIVDLCKKKLEKFGYKG